ncbi:hypothetical protein LX64_01087 [Chitinophaga skermanii]|uniref:Limonene hydroxylase n=1 Tax=Chitinophaga skermanii TaxID=331697 RepID=A0A327QUT4_9BACT|nr:hypothetical protein [Chitinophaga skermanii]RAJ08436.1 hypothetical protein LX64_01087 [Chitinophaga skermanii]
MNIFSIFKKDQDSTDEHTSPVLPWENRPSIFGVLKSNLDENHDPIQQEMTLPDEDRMHGEGSQLQWAAGARDGVLSYHTNDDNLNQKATEMAWLVKAIAENNHLKDLTLLYDILMRDDVLHYLDATIEKILTLSVRVQPYLHNYARWLAFESPDRGAVKFGIALLGLIGDKEDLENICVIGSHDEFTLFAEVAIVQMSDNPEGTLWRLAKKVHGWGRIHIVRRLLHTKDEGIKQWLMREGFRNTVMNEYLAYQCAVAGNLRAELMYKDIDDVTLHAAGDIIQALINPGPMEGIDDYDDGAVVIHQYLSHLTYRANTLSQYLLLQDLSKFLQDEKADWDARKDYGWSEDFRADLLIDIHTILAKPHWKEVLHAAINEGNPSQMWDIAKVADFLQVDTWDWCWSRLQEFPTDEASWYLVMKRMTAERLPMVLTFAEQNIPLSQIATGASKELGFHKNFLIHRCLDCILLKLGDFPEYAQNGFEFVKTGLLSPVIRNRNNAVKVLERWGKENWLMGTKEILSQAAYIEPNEDVGYKMLDLLEQ